jgi:hypothetical protein
MLRILTVLLSVVFSSNALACLGPQSEDYVLLDALPTASYEQDVVAKVRVIRRKDREATVVVVEAIKGVTLNEKIKLRTSGSSCSWLDAKSRFFQQDAPVLESNNVDVHYIAGSWQFTPQRGATRNFTGAWRGQTRVH